jgi:hypothetical protein
MRLPEQKLWTRIKNNMEWCAYCIRMERVETLINDGMPDVHCIARGITTWLELKQVAAWPTREETRVLGDAGLNQKEKNWHLAYRKYNGRVATLIGIGSFDYVLIDGKWSDAVNDMNRNSLLLAAIAHGRQEAFYKQLTNYLQDWPIQ